MANVENVENVCPQVLRGVVREVRRLAADPPAGVKLLLRDNDLTDVVALIDGPGTCPYALRSGPGRLSLARMLPSAPLSSRIPWCSRLLLNYLI